MARLTVTVSDDVMARFDAVAEPFGGRLARVRQLISEAADLAPAGAPIAPRPRRTKSAEVRLNAKDLASLDAEAAAMQLTRAAWVSALVGRWVRKAPSFRRSEEQSLIGIYMALRRIGVSINQIVRALNTSGQEGQISCSDLETLRDLRQEIRGHMQALQKAFEGNLAYWEIAE